MKRQVFFGLVFSAALAVGAGAQTGSTGAQTGTPQGPRTGTPSGHEVTVTGCLQTADMAGGSAKPGNTGAGPATTGTTGTGAAGAGASTPGATGSAEAGGAQYVLTNAQMSSASGAGSSSSTAPGASGSTAGATGSSTAGTGATGSPATGAGATGTSGAYGSSMGSRFMLVGGSQSDLRQYVNSRVEVRGTTDHQATSSGMGAPGAGATTGAPTGSTSGTTAGSATGSAAGTSAGATAGSPESRSGQNSTEAHGQKLHVTSVRQIASSCTADNR